MTPAEVVVSVAAERGVRAKDVLGKRRYSELVTARRLIARRLDESGMNCSEIGRALGMHHTSVMWLLGAIKRRD